MFGMGFTEILLIAVIAILFLGPDKLPGAMVDIAKFFRSAKDAISSVQNSFEEEIHVSEIKKEALAYKKQLEEATDIKRHVNAEFDSLASALDDVEIHKPKKIEEDVPQEVTFKKSKKKKEEKEEMSNV